MNSKLRSTLQVLCVVVWILTLFSSVSERDLAPFGQLLWAKGAVNAVALGSLWAAWRLSPDRPRTWRKNRYVVLVGLVTVAALGCGISRWAWESYAAQWGYLIFVGLCCVASQVMAWREAKHPTP